MKLSVEIYTIAKNFGDHKAIEMIKEAGFDAIDFSYYYDKECEEVLGANYKEYAKDIRAQLDRVGLSCNQAHAPFGFKYGMTMDTSEQTYLNIVRAIESASILGAKNIIVHAVTVPEEVDLEQYNIDYYKSLIPYCEAFNIHVAIENLFTNDTKRHRKVGKIGSPKELNGIIKKIDSPWIVACIDVGHASLTGYEPEDFISRVDSNILKALHVQDSNYLDDCHMLPYLESFDWTAIMTALKNNGYEGDLTFEIIKLLKKFPKELLLDTLKFSAAVGRHLISIYENA